MTAAPVPVHRLAGPRLNAEERRADVLEAAIKAFAIGGYAGTSTEEIARLAGVSQPYLFRLFGSKQALFMAAVGRCFEKVRAEFADAARRPLADSIYHPVLAAIAARYADMLKDLTLLRLQLHAYAASSDPVIRDFVRAEFARLIASVSELAGVPSSELRPFFAEGMLMNLAATLDLSQADVAWQMMCEGGVVLG